MTSFSAQKPPPDNGRGHGAGPEFDAASISARRERRLLIVLVLNVAIVVGEAIAGIMAHSLGLLADAAHNLTDVAGVGLALVAVRWARRAPTERRSFGYHRGTVLAAQANAASILAVTVVILFEGVRRLARPEPVEGLLVVVVAGIALLANTGSALMLREREDDLNMRGALLHMAADAGASLGVVIGGVVILATGRFDRIDPIVSMVIGVLISWQAWRLLRSTAEVLLESTPKGLDPDTVAEAIAAIDGVEGVHDLHMWSLSSEVRALSAHVIVAGHPTLKEAQEVGSRIKTEMAAAYRISHATLELECEGCVDDGSWCAIAGLDVQPDQSDHGHEHP
jgi:cobalt-zinc-cadmium efflux system protein